MSRSPQLFSAVILLLLLLMMGSGLSIALMWWNPHFFSLFQEWSLLIGLALFFSSILLFYFLLSLQRGSSYRIIMGELRITIEPKVVEDFLNGYMKRVLPGQRVRSRASFPRNRVEIWIDFPAIEDDDERDELLSCLEDDLTLWLEETFSYKKSFVVNAVFPS